MSIVAEFIFWASVLLIVYTYAGYPLLMFAMSRLRPRGIETEPFEPNVTVLITAYNEEKDIRQKIENTLELDYPKEKLEVMVASDGSTDDTDRIVLEFKLKGVKLFRQEGRVGKTETQNNAVLEAFGDIILFSDATTVYPKDALRCVLPNFRDAAVGCVAGKLVYVDESGSTVGAGSRSYWNYESALKRFESRACSLIGVSGCMYAVRKAAYEPMYPEACSDFLICTLLYRKGLRSVFEEEAVCFEQTNQRPANELHMRIRVIAQTFTDMWRNRDMMNPFKSGFYAIQLLSHKLLRYAIPLFLVGALASAIWLSETSMAFALITMVQVAFYAAGTLGWILVKTGWNIRLLTIPFYFILGNIAIVRGFAKFLRGERYAKWEPARSFS